jgi:uncharacterized protein Smg (DUF494 family)
MTSKVVEVVAKILEGLKNERTLEDVSQVLSKNKDFDKQTVSAAFSLVYDRLLNNKRTKARERDRGKKNIRFFSEEEINALGLDNYNYLIHLYNIGLIDTNDLEMILEQVMMFPDDQVQREDINWIILISLVDVNSEITPGSRILLYSSDTIN